MSFMRGVYFQAETGYQPFVDLYETDEDLVIEIELPGTNPEDALIKIYGDIVIIEGVKRETRAEKTVNYICMEREFGGFRRILKLPTPVNTMAGKAVYHEGVVTLKFPKLRDRVFKIKIET